MVEYIDREALFQALTDKFKARLGSSHLPTWNDAFDTAKSIPAADVVERKKGKWERLSRGDVCSECGFNTGRYSIGLNFCPNCGADMR